jgi:hypothetical protein
MTYWFISTIVFPLLLAAWSFRDDADLVARLKRREPQ